MKAPRRRTENRCTARDIDQYHMSNRPLPTSEPNRNPPTANELDAAILDLLARLPLRWEPIDLDGMSATEQEALKLLTAGGMVERRFSIRVSLIGQPECVEATLTATGECGFAEGFEPVLKSAWQAWAGEYLRGRAGAPQDQPTFHCERIGAEEARLTTDGQQARTDIEAGKARTVLDFLHRRTLVFMGTTVHGHGRTEKLRTVKIATEPGAPLQVEVVNKGPLAAIADTLTKWFEQQAKQVPDDLITMDVALAEFATAEVTIRRKIKAGELRDYRPPGAPKNSKLLLSRAELARHFGRK